MEPTIYKPSIYKGAGIYKTGAEGGGGGGDLPDAFEFLENKAIRWNSNSYNTPNFNIATCDNGGKIYIKIYQPNTDGTSGNIDNLFGMSNGGEPDEGAMLYIQGHAPNKKTRVTNKDGYSFSTVTTDTFIRGVYEYEFSQNDFRINNNHYTINYGYVSGLTKASIIPCNQNGYAPYTKASFVECKIIDSNNNVCFDALCVKRKYDNSIGIYDKVTGIYTTSQYFLAETITT